MCGLLFTNNPQVDLNKFRIALNQFYYRGPNYSEVKKINSALLGHNRLSIQDLSLAGKQPFLSSSGRFIIVFNGEIYNFRELAITHNIALKTGCDTELLIELYEKQGKNMLQELNGMFAFVIYDLKKNRYFSARDRLGIKPLYFFENNGFITYSSEVNGLKSLFNIEEVNEWAIRQYKKVRMFFDGHTIYKNIRMFPAGHYDDNGDIKEYWSLPYAKNKQPPTDQELSDLILSAVTYRRIADVSLGSYLSGGIDSSIIATLAQEPDTWTIGFSDDNEFFWSDLVAIKIGSIHTKILVSYDEFINTAKDMISIRQEPLSVPNEVLLYLMTKEVSKKNKVVLSGEGADELFFGYDRIFSWAMESINFDMEQFDNLYSYGKHKDYAVLEALIEPFNKKNYNCEDIVSHFFQIRHLHGLLRRLDNSTMRCGVEARVPFVDHRLVERMAGVSGTYKMANGIIKAPLKRIYKHILPKEVVDRKKIGFPVDLDKIFKQGNDYDTWLNFNLKVLGI
ncbi:asparagine synthase (glutamine-hydrolyzing) [Francisella philomiragia]|uniref:asparagine synthase (glutamine-hydrolyzing) n=1 Tax=Francisella philomiragia TaxID=28110 RepID=UPI001908E5C8|nr:asparagine synthase (glutamine-hydrolyzing) [Francisella philomiragia]MBK2255829.1 asparagine synthase (glutamine-hydrolyzing) [Francisella philomiragia]MBK2268487.1 asparagine synthase (glutamine-hydrolyzing) [Francisella philomiragia]MBK2271038.1 asparagine synthase (glutamine-hydrolyzing) [Francisella philomiragia]MBK2274818.1 asparagine synthase (glutamine-hydrolyzing) [Francisella philomiragia]MBK2294412.1 asparagine synthase (glutamine-hydrolyzing) [Francisella philomiragia]